MNRLNFASSVALVLLMWASEPSVAHAQVTGAIRGTVTDPQGAALPGVTVTARSPAQVRGAATVVTDANGTYRIPGLRPGTYQLIFELGGFATSQISDLVISLEQEALVDVVLQLAGVEERVDVSGAPPAVEATVSGVRERIQPAMIDSMPLEGRQFLDLVQLVPGIAPRPPDVTEGAGVTVLGGRSTTNGFLIDGMQNRDNLTGGFKEFFVQDAIQEFNVNISGFQPEYGLASGAVVNIITKSGTNDWAGRGFFFTRNDALDSSNVEGQPPPKLERYNVGGTLGGAIVRDKAWFFYAVENLNQRRGMNIDLSQLPDMVVEGHATPALGNEPLGSAPKDRRFTQFIKLDQRLNPQHQLFVSSNFNRNEQDTLVRPPGSGFIAPPAGSISLPSTGSDVRETAFSLNARETAFFGNNKWMLESTLRYVRGNFEENIDRTGGADTVILTTFTGGTRRWNTNFPLVGAQKTADSRTEWAEDLSYFGNKHTAKFGVRVDRLTASGFFRTPVLNILSNSIRDSRWRDLGLDISTQITHRVLLPVNGREGYDIKDTIVSAFAQDTWTPTGNLTVNAGVRWDYETLFEGANTNFGPRFGITWDPWKDGKTVVRGSAGIFYDAELLSPALMVPDLGGATLGTFSFHTIPRGGALFNNPALGALGGLQAGGTRFLANPTLFSYLLPAGLQLSSGGISIVGQGRPYIMYELLDIPVSDPTTPPVLSAETIPQLTGGRLTAEQALEILNAAFPNPQGFPAFFYVPAEFAGQVAKEGILAFKFRQDGVEEEEIQSFERPFKTPYTVSFNVGFDRELFPGTSVDIEYFRRLGIRLPARRVANLRDEPISSTCRGNTIDGQPCNRQLQAIGFSRVHAATVSLRKHQPDPYSYLLSYTYTRAIDNFTNLSQRTAVSSFTINNRPDLDIGRSLNAPEHVMVLSGIYRTPFGIDVSAVFRGSSGRPFNAKGLQIDSDGDTNLDERDINTKKGEFSTDKLIQLDTRLAKSFGPPSRRLTLFAETYNLLNRQNPLQVNIDLGPFIGQTVEPLPGREWQLGFRFDF